MTVAKLEEAASMHWLWAKEEAIGKDLETDSRF
jgi:hypothetical protein